MLCGAGASTQSAPAPVFDLADSVSRVAKHSMEHAPARPKKEKGLKSTINALCGKKLSTQQVDAIVASLRESNILQISENGVVTYTA